MTEKECAVTVERVGVVGAGQMGAGIAEVCARAHVDVLVYEQTRELTTAGRARVLRSLDRGVSSGKITELAVRDGVHGRTVANVDALANPEALEFFRGRTELEGGD